jgi:hypothetical protein
MKKRLQWLSAACVIAAFLTIGGGAANAQELYDPPIWGDDLEPGERLWLHQAKHSAAGPQEWGYDLLGIRYLSGRDWRRRLEGASGHDNDAYVIYGKTVHAMAPGTVIACWRNAPENAPSSPRSSPRGEARRRWRTGCRRGSTRTPMTGASAAGCGPAP